MGSLVSHQGPFFYALIQPIREHEPSRCTMHRPPIGRGAGGGRGGELGGGGLFKKKKKQTEKKKQ